MERRALYVRVGASGGLREGGVTEVMITINGSASPLFSRTCEEGAGLL